MGDEPYERRQPQIIIKDMQLTKIAMYVHHQRGMKHLESCCNIYGITRLTIEGRDTSTTGLID
jgi:hypothetical protein